VTSPEDAIRARRRLTNKLIAAHDAARLRPFFAPDIKLIAGGGGLLTGVDAVIKAFAAQFADPAFITYVRTPDSVALDAAGDHAAESGRWVAHWQAGEIGGTYLAAWRKVTGQWVIQSELYVTLS
jgi:ketosteroid isomerase-like protein